MVVNLSVSCGVGVVAVVGGRVVTVYIDYCTDTPCWRDDSTCRVVLGWLLLLLLLLLGALVGELIGELCWYETRSFVVTTGYQTLSITELGMKLGWSVLAGKKLGLPSLPWNCATIATTTTTIRMK